MDPIIVDFTVILSAAKDLLRPKQDPSPSAQDDKITI